MARVRILLVDDDPLVRQIASAMLVALGHEVTVAADGPTALEAGANGEVDLLLSDLEMPGMGGEELAARFTLQFGARPVLFMSGCSKAPAAGRLLRKPFSVVRLDTEIQRALADFVPHRA